MHMPIRIPPLLVHFFHSILRKGKPLGPPRGPRCALLPKQKTPGMRHAAENEEGNKSVKKGFDRRVVNMS
jgi:hypothetical protein